MSATDATILIDEAPVPFRPGQTILDAALEGGVYIPHLCHHPEFEPHGSCKLCSVVVNGRNASACTMKAAAGQEVEVDTPDLHAYRRTLLQMLFVEGNHFCPGCEKSGDCQLQALAYDSEMMTPHFVEFYPRRPVDASHPTCCSISTAASSANFACARAATSTANPSSPSPGAAWLRTSSSIRRAASLATANFSVADKAAHVCPVGAILIKRVGFDPDRRTSL